MSNKNTVAPPVRASLEHLTRAIEDEETQDVPLPDGTYVIVRQISRHAYNRAGQSKRDEDGNVDVSQFERRVVSAGLVDPAMTEDQVAAWQKRPGSGPELQAVMDKIMTWSGFRAGADKRGV